MEVADLLLVDDDDDLREVFVELLELEGHVVRTARNGREGMELLGQRSPDLIVLDVEMPVLSGPGMAYELFLHDAGLEEIPILLTSGVKDLDRVAGVVGTSYYLPKPFEVSALRAMLHLALTEHTPPSPHLELLRGWPG